MSFAGMLNRLHGQPESYDKKSKYRFGRTLGAGTYGVVREADGPTGKVAVKIILKKSVKGNERMVYDELGMLQKLKHPHIVQFVDWFESRVNQAIQHQVRQRTDHHFNRTSSTLSPSSPPVESSLTEFASRAGSLRKMPRRRSSKFSPLLTTCTTTTLSTEI
jgi:serine/threonine protein kinase